MLAFRIGRTKGPLRSVTAALSGLVKPAEMKLLALRMY
jgi:hypothetical protein